MDLGLVETVVVAANGGFWLKSEMEAKLRWFLMGLGFGVDKRFVVKWVKREVDSVRSG